MKSHRHWNLITWLTLAMAGAFLTDHPDQSDWIGGAVIENSFGEKTTVNVYLDDKNEGEIVVGSSTNESANFVDPDPIHGWTIVFHECYLNGKIDKSIVAITTPAPDKETLEEIHYAWRIDPSKKIAIAIPNKNIQCKNESFGTDVDLLETR